MRFRLHFVDVLRFRIHFDAFRLSVLTKSLSVFIENASIWKRSWKSGSKRKGVHIVFVWTVKNGRKRVKLETMTENIAGACVCSMRIEFNLRHSLHLYRFWTFYCGQSKKHQNGSVDAGIGRCVFDDNENAYQWKRVSVDRALAYCTGNNNNNNRLLRLYLHDYCKYSIVKAISWLIIDNLKSKLKWSKSLLILNYSVILLGLLSLSSKHDETNKKKGVFIK